MSWVWLKLCGDGDVQLPYRTFEVHKPDLKLDNVWKTSIELCELLLNSMTVDSL
jgi:hypothetical protein